MFCENEMRDVTKQKTLVGSYTSRMSFRGRRPKPETQRKGPLEHKRA
jgi:hypothetical protein